MVGRSDTCWVPAAADHCDFSIDNLPLGIFSTARLEPRPGCAIGDYILDLRAAHEAGLIDVPVLAGSTLNAFLAAGASQRSSLRERVRALLCTETCQAAVEPILVARTDCQMHLPVRIGDYTDFYAGIQRRTLSFLQDALDCSHANANTQA